MDVRDKIVVVTGGAVALAARSVCASRKQAHARVVAADLDLAGAQATAEDINASEEQRQRDAKSGGGRQCGARSGCAASGPGSLDQFGQIDVFCSNAGIYFDGSETSPNADWQKIWDVNVMAHVYAARAVLPHMLARGSGYLVQTASAAGLLNQIGSAPYGVTKHAAVGFAEWLALTYGDHGIKVSCLCPQGVRTKMLLGEDGSKDSFLLEGSVSPE